MGESAVAKWTAIVLTCRNEQIANAFQKGAMPKSFYVIVSENPVFIFYAVAS